MNDQQNQIKLIALRISDMREIRGISLEKMAELMEMPIQEYISYEEGKQDFSFSFLCR